MPLTMQGDRRLIRKLDALPKRTRNKILADEIKLAILPMRDDARRMAPVDEGDLERAIVVRAMRRKRNHVGRSVIVDPKRLDRAGDESAPNRIAGMFQETGTKYVDEDPYMGPAFGQNVRTAERRIVSRVIARVEREMARP